MESTKAFIYYYFIKRRQINHKHSRKLTAASFTDNNDHAVLPDDIQQVLPHGKHGQPPPLLLDLLVTALDDGVVADVAGVLLAGFEIRLLIRLLAVGLPLVLDAHDVAELRARQLPVLLLGALVLLLDAVKAHQGRAFSRHQGHVRGRIFHGYHGLRLLREYDATCLEKFELNRSTILNYTAQRQFMTQKS